MASRSEDSVSETTASPGDNQPEEAVRPARDEEPIDWWVKLLVWAIVAALCLAFAGLVWALAL